LTDWSEAGGGGVEIVLIELKTFPAVAPSLYVFINISVALQLFMQLDAAMDVKDNSI
jgi:hypothetical protein